MAGKNKDNGDTQQAASPQARPQGEPGLQIVAQYVKDLSFENPGIGLAVQRPQMDLNVNLEAKRSNDDHFEVTIKMRVTAAQDDKPIFLLELAYAGVFRLTNIPEESLQLILFIECPRLIFPYVRRIVSDMVCDGGLPPLMLEPIDFAALYRVKLAEQASKPTITV